MKLRGSVLCSPYSLRRLSFSGSSAEMVTSGPELSYMRDPKNTNKLRKEVISLVGIFNYNRKRILCDEAEMKVIYNKKIFPSR